MNEALPSIGITDEDLQQLLRQKHTNSNLVDMHKFCLYDKQRFKNVTLGINNMENIQSYYSVDNFNQRYQEISTDELLSSLHINVRSLLSKVDFISNLLDNLAIRPNFIAITETWLT